MGFRKRESNQEGFGIEKSNNKSVFRSANETPKKKKSTKRKKKASKPKMMNGMAEPKGAQMKYQNTIDRQSQLEMLEKYQQVPPEYQPKFIDTGEMLNRYSAEMQEFIDNPMTQEEINRVIQETYANLVAKRELNIPLNANEMRLFQNLSMKVPEEMRRSYGDGGTTASEPRYQNRRKQIKKNLQADLLEGIKSGEYTLDNLTPEQLAIAYGPRKASRILAAAAGAQDVVMTNQQAQDQFQTLTNEQIATLQAQAIADAQASAIAEGGDAMSIAEGGDAISRPVVIVETPGTAPVPPMPGPTPPPPSMLLPPLPMPSSTGNLKSGGRMPKRRGKKMKKGRYNR